MHYRDRIVRPKSYYALGHAHEITFSCNRKIPFLSKVRPCQWLAEQLDQVRKELQYDLYAYVFMPDHVHLIVKPKVAEYNISTFLKMLKEPVSRRAIQHLREHSPEWLEEIRHHRGRRIEYRFWQPGRGYDRNIDRKQTLHHMMDYIHMNPVRKGYVENASDWKWSSASWLMDCPLNSLKPDPLPLEWSLEFPV